jgi:hypothetical protein
MRDLRGRLDRLSRAMCFGALWDGLTLEDCRDALAAHRAGLPYPTTPGMVRAGVMLGILRDLRDLPEDADREALRARMLNRGWEAGFSVPEMDKLRAALVRALGKPPVGLTPEP